MRGAAAAVEMTGRDRAAGAPAPLADRPCVERVAGGARAAAAAAPDLVPGSAPGSPTDAQPARAQRLAGTLGAWPRQGTGTRACWDACAHCAGAWNACKRVQRTPTPRPVLRPTSRVGRPHQIRARAAGSSRTSARSAISAQTRGGRNRPRGGSPATGPPPFRSPRRRARATRATAVGRRSSGSLARAIHDTWPWPSPLSLPHGIAGRVDSARLRQGSRRPQPPRQRP